MKKDFAETLVLFNAKRIKTTHYERFFNNIELYNIFAYSI